MFRPDQNPNKEPALADPIQDPKVISLDDLAQTKEEKAAAPAGTLT